MDNESTGHVGVSQSASLTKRSFKLLKGLFLGGTPYPFQTFFQKIREGGHQRTVILHKALVKTTNSQKGTDVFGGIGGRPLTNQAMVFLKL